MKARRDLAAKPIRDVGDETWEEPDQINSGLGGNDEDTMSPMGLQTSSNPAWRRMASSTSIANMSFTSGQAGEDVNAGIQKLVESYTNLGQTGNEQLRSLADSTQEWGQINDEIMDAVSTQTYDLGEGVDLVFGQIGEGTDDLTSANRAMSESAVVDYGNARTAVTGWGDETETSFYNAETAASGWGDNTMLAFAGVGQSTVALGNDISGMGDIFNTAMGSMGQIGGQMFSGFETTAQNVIQGLINGDINDLDEAWDTLAKDMESVYWEPSTAEHKQYGLWVH